VLECLAANAVEHAGETVSHESVRGIADSLGLAKDTVARAIRRLAAEQIVVYVAGRGHDGRFGPSHYRLTLPSDLFVSRYTDSTSVPPEPIRHSRRPRPAQLSLLDTSAAHDG
jgi:DNA-binding transcriptional MocR family regulator